MQVISETTNTSSQGEAFRNFILSLDSEASRTSYAEGFSYFMRFCKVDNYDDMLTSPAVMPLKRLEGLIRDYMIYLREEKHSSPATVRTYSNTIAHFYEMNDVIINWKKLKKFKGRHHGVVDDAPYRRDQIKTLIDNCALRDRAMILLMTSAGLRRGALPTLRLKDLQKIEKYNLYKITVYKKEQEQYITYCTPEATKAIDDYLAWRLRIGEQPTPNTILFRSEFDITCQIKVTRPRPIQARSITHLIIELLDYTGVRPKIHGVAKYNKTSLMTCHGFRKFFNTECINHNMNPLYAEYLMGHKTGLMKSYFKPTDTELLEGNDQSLGYTAMIPYLTINATEEENTKLRERLADLKETHSKEWELVRQDKKLQAERDKQFRVEMNTKLYERNNDIVELKAAVAFLADKVNAAVIANEPSSRVIFNEKRIATAIEIPAVCKNTATCEVAKTS